MNEDELLPLLEEIRGRCCPGNEVAGRLLSSGVNWGELLHEQKKGRTAVTLETLDRLPDHCRLRNWDLDESKFPPVAVAAGGFFIFSVWTLSNEAVFVTGSDVDQWCGGWHGAANACRNALSGNVPNPALDEETRAALARVAEYFDRMATWYADYASQARDDGNPGFGGRRSAPRQRDADLDSSSVVRVQATRLAQMARELFGGPLAGTVAKIVNLGLELPKPKHLTGPMVSDYIRGNH